MNPNRIVRMLNLLTALKAEHCSMQDLVQLTGLTRRTLFRDLRVLRQAGVPIVHDHGSRRYSVASDFHLPAIHLGRKEAFGVLLLLYQVAPLLNLPFQKSIYRAALKIQSSLSSKVRQHCQSRLDATTLDSIFGGMDTLCDEVFLSLQEAISSSSIVILRYAGRSRSQSGEVHFCPVRLLQQRGDWYVLGWLADDPAARMSRIRLRKIHDVKTMKRKFLIEQAIQITPYLDDTWPARARTATP